MWFTLIPERYPNLIIWECIWEAWSVREIIILNQFQSMWRVRIFTNSSKITTK